MAHASSSIGRNDTGGDEDDHERSQLNQDAPISRAFSSPQPRIFHVSAINLHRVNFGIDKELAITEFESERTLKYALPHFRAFAVVEIPPLPAGVNIEVGWIQVCTDLQNIHTYGEEGMTSWEFPELVSGKYKMINDSDGWKYPWYNMKNAMKVLNGPTRKPILAHIHFDDNLKTRVSYDPELTFMYRKQRFYTYLALKDVNTDTYQIIRTFTWSMEQAIEVQTNKPLGERSTLLGPFEQESPEVVPERLTPPLELNALEAPRANDSQALVWRPKHGDPQFVNKPRITTLTPMELSRYLKISNDATSRLLRITKSNFLLQ